MFFAFHNFRFIAGLSIVPICQDICQQSLKTIKIETWTSRFYWDQEEKLLLVHRAAFRALLTELHFMNCMVGARMRYLLKIHSIQILFCKHIYTHFNSPFSYLAPLTHGTSCYSDAVRLINIILNSFFILELFRLPPGDVFGKLLEDNTKQTSLYCFLLGFHQTFHLYKLSIVSILEALLIFSPRSV